MRIASILFLAGLLAVGGCVTLTPNQAMDSTQREKIKTIGLFSVSTPDKYVSTAGKKSRYTIGLGAVGSLIAGGMAAHNSETLDKMLRANGFDFGANMQRALTAELERAGFKVVLIPAVHPEDKIFIEDFSTVGATQVDAILDTRSKAGYADVNDDNFGPVIGMHVRLLSWPARSTLYSETVGIIPGRQHSTETRLSVPSNYVVDGFDPVVSNPSRTIEGLNYAIATVAAHVVQQIGGAPHPINIASARYQPSVAETPRVTISSISNGAPSQNTAPISPTKPGQQKFGKHSYTIEQMAKATGCRGGTGAYLTTDTGPIEAYRIDCEGGATYQARCEYGKCASR